MCPVKSLVHSACQQTALAEACKHEHIAGARRRADLRLQCHLKRPIALNSVVSHGLLDERQRIGDVSPEGVDVSQARRGPREEDRHALAELEATFEHPDGVGELPSGEAKLTDRGVGDCSAEQVIGRVGNPHGLVREPARLSELSHIGEAMDQPATRRQRRKDRQAEALPAQIPFQDIYVRPEALDRAGIIAELVIRQGQVVACRHLQSEIAERHADGERALAGCDGAVGAHRVQRIREKGNHSPESRLIAEGFGEGLGFAKEVEHPGILAERIQGMPEIDPEINGLLERLPTLGEMLEDGQPLLDSTASRLAARANALAPA